MGGRFCGLTGGWSEWELGAGYVVAERGEPERQRLQTCETTHVFTATAHHLGYEHYVVPPKSWRVSLARIH